MIVLYVFNNQFLKLHTDGMAREFFVCYFNDFMCPFFFLSYANLLLITDNKEITSLKWLLLAGVTAGFVWEFAAPLLKKGSVTDSGDMICYIAGTAGYWGVLTFSRRAE